MPESAGCSKTRKISEDNVGKEILEKQIKRILNWARGIIVNLHKDFKKCRIGT
jgi:hypothetical protein